MPPPGAAPSVNVAICGIILGQGLHRHVVGLAGDRRSTFGAPRRHAESIDCVVLNSKKLRREQSRSCGVHGVVMAAAPPGATAKEAYIYLRRGYRASDDGTESIPSGHYKVGVTGHSDVGKRKTDGSG